MSDLSVHVLFRFSQKTGKVDKVMTGEGSALMQMWALNNTSKNKACMIVERDTGKVIFLTAGTTSGFPKVKKGDLGTCDKFGIPIEEVQSITDSRFDSEVV